MPAKNFPALTDAMVNAAAVAHYGEGTTPDGISMTIRDCDYSFRDFMERIWPAVASAAGAPNDDRRSRHLCLAAPDQITAQDRHLFTLVVGTAPSAAPIDVRALRHIAYFRLIAEERGVVDQKTARA